jgi:outer membrane protein OmpA-like peptidoglycan-associated protein
MDHRMFSLLTAGCLVMGYFLLPVADAADPAPGFAENAEEITRALTAQPVAPARTRGLKIGAAKATSRAIKVMAREGDQMVCKDVLVAEGQVETSGVNLKIEFDVNAHAIRPESFGLLAELARALQGEALKERAVVIRGHTDSDGEDAYNLALSFRRAEAVREYLTTGFGIAGHRLRVEGWGEAHPLAPNDSAARKQLNRRVEIVCGP